MNFFNISAHHAGILMSENIMQQPRCMKAPIDTKYNVIDATSRVSRAGKKFVMSLHYRYVNTAYRIIYFIRPFSFFRHESRRMCHMRATTSGHERAGAER